MNRIDHNRDILLDARAHAMRSAPTPSEARLWAAIRGKRLGVAFRRQVPIGRLFIADFVAPAAKLVIEVDGGYHGRRRKADARRDEKLRRLGYRVVRVTDRDVHDDLAGVLERVRAALAG